MKKWKRSAIIAGVLVLICTGVYLNWVYGRKAPELTETLNREKILGDATFVAGDTSPVRQTLSLEESPRGEYFAQMRLSRQKARDEAVELLQETIAYAGKEGSGRANAQLEDIVSEALAESQIESLVIAKGYEDCVAYMNGEGISLTVASPQGGMTDADAALVADIVLGQTEYDLAHIRVIPVD